jgi:hypothetical protein
MSCLFSIVFLASLLLILVSQIGFLRLLDPPPSTALCSSGGLVSCVVVRSSPRQEGSSRGVDRLSNSLIYSALLWIAALDQYTQIFSSLRILLATTRRSTAGLTRYDA